MEAKLEAILPDLELARELKATIAVHEGRVVDFNWNNSIILPNGIEQQDPNCLDCWSRVLCAATDARIRKVLHEDPALIQMYSRNCNIEHEVKVNNNKTSMQEVMEGIRDTASGEKESEEFWATMLKDPNPLTGLFEAMPMVPEQYKDCYPYFSCFGLEWIKQQGIRFVTDYPLKRNTEGVHEIDKFKQKDGKSKFVKIRGWSGLIFVDKEMYDLEKEKLIELEDQLIHQLLKGPICASLSIGQNFKSLKENVWLGEWIPVSLDTKNYLDSHEVLISGFNQRDKDKNFFYVLNTLGSNDWGLNGEGKMLFNSQLEDRGDHYFDYLLYSKVCWPVIEYVDPPEHEEIVKEVPVVSTSKGKKVLRKRKGIADQELRRSERLKQKK